MIIWFKFEFLRLDIMDRKRNKTNYITFNYFLDPENKLMTNVIVRAIVERRNIR